MLELTVLLVSITALLLFVYFKNNKIAQNEIKEPFENFYLTACPSGYKSFYNHNGDTTCCDGEIIANTCISDNQCTLNGKGTPDMPNCTDLIKKLYSDKAKEYCMPSLPNYFEDKAKKIKGCMVGSLNDTMTGPREPYQPKCVIYDSFEKNTNSIDSCANQKLLDLAQCFGNNCTKYLVPTGKAPLILIQFTDNKTIPHSAYTRQSLKNYFNITAPSWENTEWLSKALIVAEVAQAFYIDKTIQQADIIL